MLIMIQYNNPSELRVLGAQAMLEYRSLAFRLSLTRTVYLYTYVCRSFLSTSLLDILFITIVFTNQIFPKNLPTIMKTFTATSTSSLASPASRTSSSTCGIGRHHHHSHQHHHHQHHHRHHHPHNQNHCHRYSSSSTYGAGIAHCYPIFHCSLDVEI